MKKSLVFNVSNNERDIYIVGRFPPPLGGVSVYLQRRLASLKDVGADFIDFSSHSWLKKLVFERRSHYELNSMNLGILFLFFILGLSGRTTVIDHNASRHYSGVKKKAFLMLLGYFKGVAVVSERLKLTYPASIKLSLVSPFIAPDESTFDATFNSYPDEVKEFVSSGGFVINSAWRYIDSHDGDLYGIGESLELMDNIPNMRMLLAFAEYNVEEFPDHITNLIQRYQSERRLCLLVGQRELWPAFKYADAFLRLTSTDGDSVGVREAIYFDCVVVASDVVVRPENVKLYKYGCRQHLIDQVSEVLE